MGMSASQARLLAITSRINDIEFKSQQISNIKIRLADESEEVANAYTKALGKQKITINTYENSNKVSYSLNSSNLSKVADVVQLRDKSGNKVDLSKMKFSESELYEMLESGEFSLYAPTTLTKEQYDNLSPDVKKAYQQEGSGQNIVYWAQTSVSGNSQLVEETDTTEMARAEAEYNAATAKINKKEKTLDGELKVLDTEHNALSTEFDSVKTLIGDNVDKSFNLFS